MSSREVPFLDLKAQYATIKDEVRAAIDRVVVSQQFILGPEVAALEESVAAYSGCAHGIGVSSGTDALLVSLMALGVGPGDEVITTPYTFVATAMAIARLGARAVLVDIEPRAYGLDVSRVEAAITARTKAILPVHLYGQMGDVAGLVEIAGRHGIAVVEDAAQAIGAEASGRRAGSAGSLGCLSFFPSKNLGGFGDGGMVLTNDARLADRVRLLRNQGQQPKHHSLEVGGNFRLDALQAAVLRAKLPHLDAWTEGRRRNAERYRALLEGAELTLPVELPGHRHVYNQFVIQVKDRDELRQRLADRRIGSEVYYPEPVHLQPAFASWGYRSGDFPVSERAAAHGLALPIYPELEPEMLEAVVAAVRAFLGP
jgi:dTDP-4-amino-4,6-dideoxygalactose transaminase